jgi:hypothetical protein
MNIRSRPDDRTVFTNATQEALRDLEDGDPTRAHSKLVSILADMVEQALRKTSAPDVESDLSSKESF